MKSAHTIRAYRPRVHVCNFSSSLSQTVCAFPMPNFPLHSHQHITLEHPTPLLPNKHFPTTTYPPPSRRLPHPHSHALHEPARIRTAPTANASTNPPHNRMGKRGTVLSCLASISAFALGATLGCTRTRRRHRAAPPPPPPPPPCDEPTPLALDCPICLTEVVLPRVATCGHTLCTACLAALFEHERRPACPVCRKKIRLPLEKLPINFMVSSIVEARARQRGGEQWSQWRMQEEEARRMVAGLEHADGSVGVWRTLRPAWNWFKWSVIIVTELGAFLVSLKEVLESAPNRGRRYQRIV